MSTSAVLQRTRWCVITLAVSLSACVTVPVSTAPRAPLRDTALGLHGVAVDAAPSQWWQAFGDPQLDALIGAALQDNPNLRAAGARLQLARSTVEAARAAQLPDLRLSGGESRLKIPGVVPHPLGGQSVWAGDLGATFSWDLDLWGRNSAALAQASALREAADLELAEAQLLLTGAVVQAYVDLDRAYALADVASQAEAQRGHILEITRRRVSAGLDTRVELREAEGAVPQAHVILLQAQAAQALAIHELAALTGRGADAYDITRPQLRRDAVLVLPEQLPLNLLARRPDIIAAYARVQAADAQQRAAKAAFYPQVSLTALAGYAAFSLKDLIGEAAFGYEAGAAISLPLFDAGRLRAQYHGAEAGVEAAAAAYDDTVVAAVHQAADQLSLIDSLSGELEQQRAALDAVEDAYRLAQERYQAGLATYLSVLNAEGQVLSERRTRVELDSMLTTARVTLLLAVGGDFHPPQNVQAVAAR